MEHSMSRFIPLLSLILCLPAAAADHAGEAHRPWSDVEHWADLFDDPARDEWQKPLTLLEFVGVLPGDTVADLGAGTGYFTRPISIRVGVEGKVYAVDIEQAMLDHLMARGDIVTERVIPVLGTGNDPGLPEAEIDVIVVINTWHHIDKRTKYLRKLQKSLTPEGRLVIVDFREGELPVGPPPEQKLSHDGVVSELERAGWRFVAESVALPYQYAMIFLPPPSRDTRTFLHR
jgi:ubiquinone/menaquinone biosynthesis C-methylase UbiE